MSIELEDLEEDLGKQAKHVEGGEEAGPHSSTKEEVAVTFAPHSSTSEEKTKTIKRLQVVIALLSILLALSIIAIAAILVMYVRIPPDTRPDTQPDILPETRPHTLPTRFYDENYLKYITYFSSESRSKKNEEHNLSKRQLFNHVGACGTQQDTRKYKGNESDPLYYTSNNGISLHPTTSGFMGTIGRLRYLTVRQQVLTLLGEPKHDLWRVQENGFIRVYRKKGSKEGILAKDKDAAIRSGLDYEKKNGSANATKLLNILDKFYMSIDQKHELDYAFSADWVSKEGWLNWIDLPIYHKKFGKKYDDHVPIDLPYYWCQMSSDQFPHMGITWDYIKAQPLADKIGPLGKRAGLDIQEIAHNAIRMEHFPDAGVWANIGQETPNNGSTNEMPRNLKQAKTAQSVNYQRIDTDKVDVEVYVVERSYVTSTSTDNYLCIHVVFLPKDIDSAKGHTYIRPDGYYYNGLKYHKGEETINKINTVPPWYPTNYVKNHKEEKKIYGTAAWGLDNIDPYDFGQLGGGCPSKGGDYATYPFGNTGSGWPTNYEEITSICLAYTIDLKLWANLGNTWDNSALGLGNSGIPYKGKTRVTYRLTANVYGNFTDPWNIKKGYKNPDLIDLTKDGKIVYERNASHPTATIIFDFGKLGEAPKFNDTMKLDLTPRTCVKDAAESTDYSGPL